MMNAETYPPSPVPSDELLRPGQRPFTAFGQFGVDMLDLRVFEQDIYWVDRSGRAHLVAEMSPVYVFNVVAFLERHVDGFHRDCVWRWALATLGDVMLGSVPAAALELELGQPWIVDLSPEEWLEATPLMRALRRRLAISSTRGEAR